MQVETYEDISIDEQSGQIINEIVSEEALALIETLGLAGQQQLVEKYNAGEEVVEKRIPYRQMTMEEFRVYNVLMPYHTELTKYKDGPVPLRVLQIAAHAKEFFDDLIVWHPKPGQDDPILVGRKKMPGDWQQSNFILARWGDILVPFEELKTKAISRLTNELRVKVKEAKSKVDSLASNLEDRVLHFLDGGDDINVYVSINP